MKILLLIILTILISCAYSHSEPRRIVGSFVCKGLSYNYEFKSLSIENYSLRITTAHQSLRQQPLEVDTVTATELESNEEIKKLDDLEAKDKAESSGDTIKVYSKGEPEYIFSEFDKDVFQAVFKNQMIHKHEVDSTTDLHDKSSEIFFKIKAKFDFLDDEPVTAYLILRRDFVHSLLKGNTSVYYTGALSRMVAGHRVSSVQVETEEGTIKNIIAQFVAPSTKIENVSPRNYVEFKNAFPISISGKYDSDYFANIRLYCLNCYGVKGLDRFIKLSDLLTLDVVLENDKENYSPVNSKIELNPANTIVELRKEKRSKILEVAAFTDFIGLDQEQPNGLIQIEAKRRINIVTKSRQVRSFETVDDIANQLNLSGIKEIKRRYELIPKPKDQSKSADAKGEIKKGDGKTIKTKQGKRIIYTLLKEKLSYELPVLSSDNLKVIKDTIIIAKTKSKKGSDSTYNKVYKIYEIALKNKHFHSPYWVFANYLEPKLLFSKIEQNNRFIDSLSLKNNKIDGVKLLQYQLISIGATLNLVRLSIPQAKLSFNALSVGGYWFRSRVGFSSDSSRTSIPLNNSYFLLISEIIFRPDSRWGVTLGVNYIKPNLWNGSYELSNSHPVLQPYFDAFLKTNESDKLFFRFRWSYEHKNRDNNFTQVQLGYNINLFANSNQGKPK